VVVVAGISVRILIHAEKEKSETTGSFEAREGSGKVRNCPVDIVTNDF